MMKKKFLVFARTLIACVLKGQYRVGLFFLYLVEIQNLKAYCPKRSSHGHIKHGLSRAASRRIFGEQMQCKTIQNKLI